MTTTTAARRLPLLGALLLAVAFLAAACSSGSAAVPSVSAGPSLSNGQQIDAVVAGLDQALTLYKNGSHADAVNAVADAYLNHFEFVEQQLASKNETFMTTLESLIATKIRQSMAANESEADIESLISQAKTQLATAKGMLQ